MKSSYDKLYWVDTSTDFPLITTPIIDGDANSSIQVIYDNQTDDIAVLFGVYSSLFVKKMKADWMKTYEVAIENDDVDTEIRVFNIMKNGEKNKNIRLAGLGQLGFMVIPPTTSGKASKGVASLIQPDAYFDRKGILKTFYFNDDYDLWYIELLPTSLFHYNE